MGQKVNPHGLRVGVIKDWDSRWFAGKATFGDTLVEDYKIRDYLMNKRMFTKVTGEKTNQLLSRAVGIADIQIERMGADKIKIYIFDNTSMVSEDNDLFQNFVQIIFCVTISRYEIFFLRHNRIFPS